MHVRLFKALLRQDGTLYLLPVCRRCLPPGYLLGIPTSTAGTERCDLDVVSTRAGFAPEGHVQHAGITNADHFLL